VGRSITTDLLSNLCVCACSYREVASTARRGPALGKPTFYVIIRPCVTRRSSALGVVGTTKDMSHI